MNEDLENLELNSNANHDNPLPIILSIITLVQFAILKIIF
jgi:hypothetical protein